MVFGLVRRNGQGLGAGIRAGSAAFERRLLGPPQERVSTKAHRADRLPHDSASELRGNWVPLPCGGVLRYVLTSATICPHLGGEFASVADPPPVWIGQPPGPAARNGCGARSDRPASLFTAFLQWPGQSGSIGPGGRRYRKVVYDIAEFRGARSSWAKKMIEGITAVRNIQRQFAGPAPRSR